MKKIKNKHETSKNSKKIFTASNITKIHVKPSKLEKYHKTIKMTKIPQITSNMNTTYLKTFGINPKICKDKHKKVLSVLLEISIVCNNLCKCVINIYIYIFIYKVETSYGKKYEVLLSDTFLAKRIEIFSSATLEIRTN